jgi:hypothetical protein
VPTFTFIFALWNDNICMFVLRSQNNDDVDDDGDDDGGDLSSIYKVFFKTTKTLYFLASLFSVPF